jgi:D-arabinose 1-dehydrogenase-like Zn-dependent alcohol dehydrogenase
MWARVYAYIVMHMYLNILGFGATYYMVVLVDPLSFHITMPSSSTALCMATVYFSAVTMATVGFGDIYPVSGIGYLLVCVQIAAGPLLLSMVLLGLGDSVPTRLSLDRSTGGLS